MVPVPTTGAQTKSPLPVTCRLAGPAVVPTTSPLQSSRTKRPDCPGSAVYSLQTIFAASSGYD
eukprot:5528072-Pyramimonas_sp.AAC.1